MVELFLLAAALSADNFAVSIGCGKQQYENFTRHDGAAESDFAVLPWLLPRSLEKDFCSPQDRNGEPEWVRAAFFLWER